MSTPPKTDEPPKKDLHLIIPSCIVHQLVNDHRIPLTTGPLTLSTSQNTPETSLLLHISPITLPLSPATTIARTHPNRPNTYLIGTSSGVIELTFDSTIPQLDSLATQFEALLVHHNLLTTGLTADADNITGFLEAAAAKVASGAANLASKKIQSSDGGTQREVPGAVKTMVGSAASTTGAVAEITGQIAEAAGQAAERVGEWVAGKVGTREEVVDAVTAVEVVGDGAKGTVGEVQTRVGDDVAEVVGHEQGREVREVVDRMRDTGGNVGRIVGDVSAIPSKAMWEAGAATVGAGKVEERAIKLSGE
ncbi:hypothetical protein EX30DRAFT_183719 [Ascodesmis nigricans]|uniref:Senescence domain-containing protein n=1 Tax=Ascodesmis nigricans TaxID=341454 RepID=A0A4S2N0A9_9PEZI|nr:hypothetical protein EX30DRAFT_183719 [Ascodesmis nigricans]